MHRPAAAPETGVLLAGYPETGVGWSFTLKHHTITVLPKMPGDQQNEAVEVSGGNPRWTGGVPEMRDIDAHHVDTQCCPHLQREGAPEDDVVAVLRSAPTEFTA
jgi:hypothetical protein